MAANEKGYDNILYKRHWAEVIMKLPDDVRLSVHDAICRFLLTGEDPNDDVLYRSPYLYIKTEIERDKAAYEEKREMISLRNRENGKKGGRPRSKTQITQQNPVGFSKTQITQKKAERERVMERDNIISSSNEDVSTLQVDPEAKTMIEKVKSKSIIDFERLAAFWNTTMADKGIKQISKMTDKRKSAVAARGREYGKDAIVRAIKKAAESKFLNGDNDRAWIATFDWMFLPKNFPKVLEGNFDNKPTSHRQTIYGDTEQEQRMKGAANIIASLMAEEKNL